MWGGSPEPDSRQNSGTRKAAVSSSCRTHSEQLSSSTAGGASLSAGSHTTSRPRASRHASREPPGASWALWMSGTGPQCWFSGMTHTSVEIFSGRRAASNMFTRVRDQPVSPGDIPPEPARTSQNWRYPQNQELSGQHWLGLLVTWSVCPVSWPDLTNRRREQMSTRRLNRKTMLEHFCLVKKKVTRWDLILMRKKTNMFSHDYEIKIGIMRLKIKKSVNQKS